MKIIEDATCTFCGCLCDDIQLKVDGHRIVEAENACPLGQAWFLAPQPADVPACLIDGQPAALEEGIRLAAEILTTARYPLIYGLSDTTCEAQRVAVGIADRIGGSVDTTTSISGGSAGMTLDGVGDVTATLGEILHRGDLIFFWGTDPAESHPRHFTRYSLTPKGIWTPRGREDRTCVVIDVRETETARAADLFLQIDAGKDFEALWTLRALANGLDLDSEQVERETGVAMAAWQELMDRMKQAHYGAILFGTDLSMPGGAVSALVRDMNEHTRFVSRPMRGGGNVAGADNVLTWRTGYPFGVNLSRGYPRFNPGEYTAADLLRRGEADAALIVASDPMDNFPEAAREHLASIPSIAIDSRPTATTRQATVAFRVATYGINVAGSVYRTDDVPLPLRPAVASPLPSDLEILREIERLFGELL
ncbi:MAG: formylmethanofuran dehydrogenase subunit B [Rhodopirellula sp.]|nr:formylmethanofuran dehydrogenase subunit B [Rhodopirellula sp.]